ncbi:MAG: Nif3-like dinuclear metal center hexameric protein [Clostridiales bacterium]|nr:Nif3-like dinuclear metal center hexameric protein [Candidatus Cacconaster stercorequi]
MTTVKDIEKKLFDWAPRDYAESWDNVGLLCGRENQEVRRILVALDPFLHVCQEALAVQADLIVTHHPLIFTPAKSVTDRDAVGQSILFLAQHGISAINAHTNLDQTVGGVNDQLVAVLGLQEVEVIRPCGTDEMGRPWGLLRAGTIEETDLPAFAAMVKERLNCPGLRYISGGRSVHRVAVGGGACGDEMREVVEAGCDTFVTADIKYNQFWSARDLGLNLIDAGHFETENPICRVLVDYLRKSFPEIEVILSKKHGDPVQFL